MELRNAHTGGNACKADELFVSAGHLTNLTVEVRTLFEANILWAPFHTCFLSDPTLGVSGFMTLWKQCCHV